MKLLECVPNFSEGRDKKKIELITKEIENTKGAILLDVDPGPDTNRTVVTFVGNPESVIEAAYRAIKKASELIDMRTHKGAHPRMGATDVCPLIPISGITDEECVAVSVELARRVGDQLNIPVYMYEKSAVKPQRVLLAEIRKGEYEALEEKMKDEYWRPDFGPATFNAKSGATVIGVRDFLIAYNINLNSTDPKIAKDIGKTISDSGRFKRDEKGKIVLNEKGEKIKIPGTLKSCKATGWYLPDFNVAQVTMNLTDYRTTGIHTAFEEVRRQADLRGALVTGSEIVGLVPLEAIKESGRYFLSKQGECGAVNETKAIESAVMSLGLSSLYGFEPEKKIIEYVVGAKKGGKLASKKVYDFIDEVSSNSVAPGGGSVSSLLGSLGSALTAMVANLTFGHKNFSEYKSYMEETAFKAHELKEELSELIDKDTDAFNEIITAGRMPKKTEEEINLRSNALEKANKEAAEVPLRTCACSVEVLKILEVLASRINPNSISDAGVAALSAFAAAEGAFLNVLINLSSIGDDEFRERIKKEAQKLMEDAKSSRDKIMKSVYGIITEPK
ncbi:glutamate formimidoyltransferase [candidate division WOR-3 bacterium]|nr:glutamate formimidoyltransferase [candidate division WOR-3 bacterium]